MNNLLVKNVVPLDGVASDVRVIDGLITEIAPALSAEGTETVLDGEGRMMYPAFVDAHSHMDKTMVGMPWYRRETGRPLLTMIADERELRLSDAWDYERQIGRQARVMIANGTSFTRAFVDIDTEGKLAGFEAMLATKKAFAEALSLQIVAFPQSGVAARPGTVELLEEALAAGADVIGGMDPCLIERDPVRHVDLLFSLAEKYGVGVDVHLHERGTMGQFSAELIIERTKALGLAGKVMISHPDFLGDIPEADAFALIDAIAEAGVNITSNAPGSDPKPPMRRLLDVGVTVASGCDGICDSWGPMNRSDMLHKAYQLAWRNGMGSDDELRRVIDLVTVGGAKAMALEGYGLAVGDKADFVLLQGEVHVQPIIAPSFDRTVVKAGRVVAAKGECLI